MTSQATARVYVACLASYNAGTLHGAWIDLTADASDIADAIAGVLAESPEPGAEEWAIHDHEGLCGLLSGESADPEELAQIAEVIESADDVEALEAFVDYGWNKLDTLADDFEEHYLGEHDSEIDYASDRVESIDLLDGCNEVAAFYFDYEAYSRDLFLGDLWSAPAPGGGVYVFSR